MYLEEEKGWSIRVLENPGIVEWKLGRHIYFWSGDAERGDIDPSFSSAHIDVLSKEESGRAYARMKTLLRIVSGISILRRGDSIKLFGSLYYLEKGIYSSPSIKEDIDITLEELENPFDYQVTKNIRDYERELWDYSRKDEQYIPTFNEFLVDESIDDPYARNILLWLSLGEEELLYFITNAYKIMETINKDTGVNRKKSEKVIPDFLKKAIKEMKRHGGYMNTKADSGILSRHGDTFDPASGHRPSIEELKKDLNNLVLSWFQYRFYLKYKKESK